MTVYTLFLYIGIAALVLLLTLGIGHSKWRKHEVRRPIVWYLQYFVGSLLLFSGFIKAVDPLGTAYKMQDYFQEFEQQGFPGSAFFYDQALPFSVLMLVVELVLGFCLILGIGGRITTLLTLLMMVFFTWLTGFNYLTGFTPNDPDNTVGIFQFSKWTAFDYNNIRIKDCGCFGDFMKLTPLTTFVKDIILMAMTIALHLKGQFLKDMLVITADPNKKQISSKYIRIGVVGGLVLLTWLFCLNNYKFNDALIDFRPFYAGVDLREAKKVCTGPVIEVNMVYEHEQTKEQKQFNMAAIADSTNWKFMAPPWKYQSRKDVVVKEACTSKIVEFGVKDDSTAAQMAMMEAIYESDKPYIFVIMVHPDEASESAIQQIVALATAAEKEGIKTMALYSDKPAIGVEEFRHKHQMPFPLEWSDDKLLKTIIRANPGVVLIHKGVIKNKWHDWHIPTYETLKSNF